MANFSKRAEECVTEVDKMLFLLKNIGRMMNQPGWLQHEVYTRIFNACEIAGFDEDKRIKYDKDMNDEKRLQSEMNTARRIGFENGRKEGLAKGREEGLVEGREEGRAEGRAEIIRQMHSNGMSAEQISGILNIAPHEIEAILK